MSFLQYGFAASSMQNTMVAKPSNWLFMGIIALQVPICDAATNHCRYQTVCNASVNPLHAGTFEPGGLLGGLSLDFVRPDARHRRLDVLRLLWHPPRQIISIWHGKGDNIHMPRACSLTLDMKRSQKSEHQVINSAIRKARSLSEDKNGH